MKAKEESTVMLGVHITAVRTIEPMHEISNSVAFWHV